ncbi:MAG: thioredoxin family protein [Leptospirales bacterium]|nr:thioredoxin family protein [Leptospirales bacterium]
MKLRIVAIVLISCANLLLAQPQAPQPDFRPGVQSLSLRPGGDAAFSVQALLPARTHLYIRHVDARSFNIVTTFSAVERGFRVDVEQAPTGELKDQDYVLESRGAGQSAGEYRLKLFETLGRAPAARPIPVTLLIKTQLCNSATNVCYRPVEIRRTLQVTVSGERQVRGVERAIDTIQWAASYDQALQKARASGQNIFVLITAPTWCGYCQQLERNVMSKAAVATVLNGKFIPLKVLDSSSDLRRFQFDGYPTMLAVSSEGRVLAEVGGRDEQSFLNSLRQYERTAGGSDPAPASGASFNYTASIRGRFVQNAEGWSGTVEGAAGQESFREIRRDESYVVLQNTRSQEYLAIPLRGGQGFIFRDQSWQPYMQVTPAN